MMNRTTISCTSNILFSILLALSFCLLPSFFVSAASWSPADILKTYLAENYPWEEIEAALLRVAVNPPETLLNQLQDGDRGLLRAVNRVLPHDEETELVLIIDQFEEIFTLVEEEAVREQFLNSLVTAVLDDSSRLRIVITMRADFYDRPLQYVDFGDLLRQQSISVLPMTPDELEQAISRPVLGTGVSLEPRLAGFVNIG